MSVPSGVRPQQTPFPLWARASQRRSLNTRPQPFSRGRLDKSKGRSQMLDVLGTELPPGNDLGNLDKKCGTREAEGRGRGDLLDTAATRASPALSFLTRRVPRVWTTLSISLSPRLRPRLGPSQPAWESLSKKSFFFLPTRQARAPACPLAWLRSPPGARGQL